MGDASHRWLADAPPENARGALGCTPALYGARGTGDHHRAHAMSRPRIASTTVSARFALSLVALGLTACSFSFKSGSSASSHAGKPAVTGDSSSDGASSKPTKKPIHPAEPKSPSHPAEPTPDTGGTDEDAGPTRKPPTPEPPPSVEPSLTAVCRVQDPTLESLCHQALDPIAADDVDTWATQLAAGVVLTRPTYRRGMQRLEGPKAIRDVAGRSGGLRAMLHLRPTDRIVGTLSRDCRQCRRAMVEFQANTRSGTITVDVEMTQPPTIIAVEVDSHVRRPHLEGLRHPTTPPPKKPAVIVPPAKPEPEPSQPIVEPKAEPSEPSQVIVPPEPAEPPKPAKKKPAKAKKEQPQIVAPEKKPEP